MMIEEIKNAINNKQLISFVYKDEIRVVEPHLVGVNIHKKPSLRAWQVSGEKPGWKLFHVDRIEIFTQTELFFSGTRPNYNPKDKQMEVILESLKVVQ